MIWGAVHEESDPLSACLRGVSRDLRGVLYSLLLPSTSLLSSPLFCRDPLFYIRLPHLQPFSLPLTPPPPLSTSLLPPLSVILISSKTSFPWLWELAHRGGHHRTPTDSSHHKQLVGVGMLAALQFQARSFWQVIFLWRWLLFSLLLFFFPVTSDGG